MECNPHTIHTHTHTHSPSATGHSQVKGGRRERRLVSDYSLNACNEPENLLCAQIRSCCGQMDPDTGLRRQTAKNARRTGAAAAVHPFLYTSPLLSCTLPSISVSLLCLCHPVYLLCLQSGRKKKVQEKGGKDLRAILDTTNKLKKLTSSIRGSMLNLKILYKRQRIDLQSNLRNT